MKKKLLLFLAFVVLGILQAVVFMIVNGDSFAPYSFAQCLLALIYSVPQSLIVSAWAMLPVFLAGLIYVWIRGNWHRRFIIGYVTFIAIPVVFLCIIDWSLFGYWGTRLDRQPFEYFFDNPGEAAIRIPWWSYVLTVLTTVILSWLTHQIMSAIYPRRRSGSITRMNSGVAQQREGLLNLLILGLCFVIATGFFGLLDITSANHSEQMMLNQAAINPIYSLFYSL